MIRACDTDRPSGLVAQVAECSEARINLVETRPDDAKQWLTQFGNPDVFSLADIDGRVGIDYGVYGVPETFVIDKQGVIRHKVIGPVTPAILAECLTPLTELLRKDAQVESPEMKKVMKQCA